VLAEEARTDEIRHRLGEARLAVSQAKSVLSCVKAARERVRDFAAEQAREVGELAGIDHDIASARADQIKAALKAGAIPIFEAVPIVSANSAKMADAQNRLSATKLALEELQADEHEAEAAVSAAMNEERAAITALMADEANAIAARVEALEGEAHVVVVSEGVGRRYLAKQPQLPNLTLLDFQPYARLPEILATADVLLATLEEDAGAFAVPSKVLTYLCAGRPVLLTAPVQNLAAEVIRRSGGGVVVEPNDAIGWVEAARKLGEDAELRASLGAKARQHAEATFDIGKIADRFEAVLIGAAERRFHNSATALRHEAASMAAPR